MDDDIKDKSKEKQGSVKKYRVIFWLCLLSAIILLPWWIWLSITGCWGHANESANLFFKIFELVLCELQIFIFILLVIASISWKMQFTLSKSENSVKKIALSELILLILIIVIFVGAYFQMINLL